MLGYLSRGPNKNSTQSTTSTYCYNTSPPIHTKLPSPPFHFVLLTQAALCSRLFQGVFTTIQRANTLGLGATGASSQVRNLARDAKSRDFLDVGLPCSPSHRVLGSRSRGSSPQILSLMATESSQLFSSHLFAKRM